MFKTGIGFDAHPLVEDRPLVIGGVNIPHSRGLLGHSDADVLVHAVMDAILGALALGDIGDHFPDTDKKWLNVSGKEIFEIAYNKVRKKGFSLKQIDIVVIALLEGLQDLNQNLNKILPQRKVFLIRSLKYLNRLRKQLMIMKNVNLRNKELPKDLKVIRFIKIQKIKYPQKKGN